MQLEKTLKKDRAILLLQKVDSPPKVEAIERFFQHLRFGSIRDHQKQPDTAHFVTIAIMQPYRASLPSNESRKLPRPYLASGS